MTLRHRLPAQGLVRLAQVEEHLALADLRLAYDAGGGRGGREAGGGDVAELLVLVRQGAALDLAVQRGTGDPGGEVAPVLAGDDGAGRAVRAGRGDMEPGADQAVAGLDDAGVAVGGARLDDHDGLGGGRGGVHHGAAVGLGQLTEDVRHGHEISALDGER